MKAALRYITSRIIAGRRDVERLKSEALRLFPAASFPRNSQILRAFPKDKLTSEIRNLLLKRPMRTLSGVTPVAIMVQPQNSCRWSCIYCLFTGKAPKSYTGEEPAALRARQCGFDPSAQVRTRLRHYSETGHPTSKCELIVMGGSFLQMPKVYRRSFIKSAYDAFNGSRSPSLASAKARNEVAKNRVIGLTIETRPDLCGKEEINEMLEYGVTRVELGVQHPSNRIYKKIMRGHTVSDVFRSTALLKDSAFKICYHIMPGLPGSDEEKDIQMFRKLFTDQRFQPDMLKIYPTLVMPGTPLYKMWKKGEYQPYSTEKAARVIARAYAHIPPYVRVMRVQRDIPLPEISAGVRHSNLREGVERAAGTIQEIRSREIKGEAFSQEEATLRRIDYNASNGKEIFLSYECGKKLVGFLRLRIPSNPFRKEITPRTSLVRELHVYGQEAPIGRKGNAQHLSFGTRLLREAERISSEEFDSKKVLVISGVGTKEYYFSRGYSRDGPYVSLKL